MYSAILVSWTIQVRNNIINLRVWKGNTVSVKNENVSEYFPKCIYFRFSFYFPALFLYLYEDDFLGGVLSTSELNKQEMQSLKY